jgi:hypothetical protein
MKKILFLILTVLIVSCSSDDDNSNIQTCGQSSIPGTWDSEVQFDGVSVLTLAFNSDGTGTYTYFEDAFVDFIWESTDSAITASLAEDDIEVEWWVADYEFFGCDQLSLHIVSSIDDTTEDIDLTFDRR